MTHRMNVIWSHDYALGLGKIEFCKMFKDERFLPFNKHIFSKDTLSEILISSFPIYMHTNLAFSNPEEV